MEERQQPSHPPLVDDDYERRAAWKTIRQAVQRVAESHSEWAGAPMPIANFKLVVEPRYPIQTLQHASLPSEHDAEHEQFNMDRVGAAFDFSQDKIFPINAWYSRRKQADIWVYHTGDGRSKVAIMPNSQVEERLKLQLNTLAPLCEEAWDYDAELRAMARLKELVTPHQYRCYIVTGQFLESSQRSKVAYLFRRCRPTLALKELPAGQLKILAALCLHPICYYHQTHAGGMVASDDVIAHLLLMRADEHFFWKKANQHPLDVPQSGI